MALAINYNFFLDPFNDYRGQFKDRLISNSQLIIGAIINAQVDFEPPTLEEGLGNAP